MSIPIATTAALGAVAEHRTPSGAQQLLTMGGIALIVAGMIFGDVFAVFVLHQNGDRIGERLVAAAHAVAAGDVPAVEGAIQNIGGLLENRGTEVDAHVHIIDFGYLALLLALLQPHICFSEAAKRRLAKLFLWGAVLLPVGVFCIHYVGLQYSPFSAIGWASVVADLGGGLVLVALLGFAVGFRAAAADRSMPPFGWCGRVLATGGTLLVLAGFLHGAYYAGVELSHTEAADRNTLGAIVTAAETNHLRAAEESVGEYGKLQAAKAIHIAAHSHIIEFGLLSMLLSFFQPYVMLSERWRRRWVGVLLAGSVSLPVFVLLELRLGLVAGGLADLGGALVIAALLGMLVGVIRYSGQLDAGVRA